MVFKATILKDIIAYLNSLTLVQALWWFIENINDEDAQRTELFLYLRERYRKEEQ